MHKFRQKNKKQIKEYLHSSKRIKSSASRSKSPSFVDQLADFICGVQVDANERARNIDCSGVVGRLRADLSDLHQQMQIALSQNNGLPTSAIFPFLARKFLEISLTAILARVDPLRLIAARKNQTGATYEMGKRNLGSISWVGDIFPKESMSGDTLWCDKSLKSGPERSLLGWHMSEVGFKDGLNWLSDQDSSKSKWIRELSQKDDKLGWITKNIATLYSQLSKGVHAEFLIDERANFSQAAIETYLQDCYMFVCLLAAATHYSSLFARPIDNTNILKILMKIESEISLG